MIKIAKEIFLPAILILVVFSFSQATPAGAADKNEILQGGGGAEKWAHLSEGEVGLMVPGDWTRARNPAKGILFQLSPNSSAGQTFFSHMHKTKARHDFELTEKDRDTWRLLAESIHGRLVRAGLSASIKSEKLIELNGRKALDVRLDIGNPLGAKGFCRFVFLKVKRIGYGFMAFSLGDDLAAHAVKFDRMIASITIDESKMPAHIGPRTYAELTHVIKSAVQHGLKGIPPRDWEYALKDVRAQKADQAPDLIIEASLARHDAALLASAFAKVIDSLRKRVELAPDQLGCDQNLVMSFSNHISMIFGLALSFGGNPELPLRNIHIVLSDGKGGPAAHYIANIAEMLAALQSEDNMKFILAIESRPD